MGACHCRCADNDVAVHPEREQMQLVPEKVAVTLLDEYGFRVPNVAPITLSRLTIQSIADAQLALQWREIAISEKTVDHWRVSNLVAVQRLLAKGIPCECRSTIWLLASGASSLRASSPRSYASYFNAHQDESVIRQIEVDVPRTYSDHRFFTGPGRGQLTRLLNALADRLGKDVRYVQGMNIVTGLILLVCDDEEMAFWIVVAFMERLNMKALYVDGLDQLQACLRTLGQLISSKLPDVRRYFGEEGIEPFCYGTPWFLTMFAYALPVRQCARLFDVAFIMHQGQEWVYRFAIAYVQSVAPAIVKMPFTSATALLKTINVDDDELERLILTALRLEWDDHRAADDGFAKVAGAAAGDFDKAESEPGYGITSNDDAKKYDALRSSAGSTANVATPGMVID